MALESDLPPEFVITKHAMERMPSRVDNKYEHSLESVMEAWYYGKEPPPTFIPDSAYRPIYFRNKFVYKYFNRKIYVFGIRKGKYQYWHTTKYLLTIYNWH